MKVNASSLFLIMLSPLILDVELGIGIIKNALNAQMDGYSILKKSVSPLVTSANLMLKMEIVLNAI